MATANRTFIQPAADPVSGDARARQQQAQAFLLRLTRAVQRAAIYPAGHPAVSQGVGPLVDTLRELVSPGAVTVAVGRTRLLVSGGDSAPTEHELPWLAARLFDRHISAFTIAPELDAAELARFVAWLSAIDDTAGHLPEFGGLTLSRFDGRHLRFRDDAPATEAPAAAVAWHALTAPLRQVYDAAGAAPGDADSASLSDRIRQALHRSEGTGVTELAGQLVRVYEDARTLDTDEHAAVTARLAALVNDLSPELRGSLLATSGDDGADKLSLLEALLPHVSPAVLAAIAGGVTIAPTVVSPAFARFLDKLSAHAAGDPAAREALERRIAAPHVPAVVAEAANAHPVYDPSRPVAIDASYTADLDRLAASRQMRSAAPLLADDAFGDGPLDEHLGRIALEQLRKDLGGAEAPVYWTCLLELAPRLRARRSISVLAAIADLVVRLRAVGGSKAPDLMELESRLERLFAEPESTALALDVIAAGPAEGGELSSMLLGAGGKVAMRAALDWFSPPRDEAARARVAVVLATVDPDLFKSAVAPSLVENTAAADAVADVIGQIDPARAIDIAFGLTTHPRPDIRRRVLAWLLQAPLGAARLQRALQRGLEDGDRGVVSIAVDAAVRVAGPAVVEPLTAFAGRRVPADLAPDQRRAIRMLGGRADGATRLADLLRHRGYFCGGGDRGASAAMATVLEASSAGPARAAASAWRWTPAGLLSALLDRGGEAS